MTTSFRSGSGTILTVAELLDARARHHRIYEVRGTTPISVVSLRYSPLPSMPAAPVGAPPVDDWDRIEEELRAEVEERGFPHHKHPDEQWRSISAIARRYARIDEEDPYGAALRTARRQIAEILKRLRLGR
jgi:hypothetical protein